jgi:hypothetical protein
MNIYRQAGYENREACLEELSEAYDIELSTVFMLADIFGEDCLEESLDKGYEQGVNR